MENLRKGILVKNGVAVGAVGDKYFSTCPLGTVLSYAGNIIPRGFLVCNGASYKVADYPDLYAVIGNTYGGDTENFNVPNLIDKFIQGSTTSGTEKKAGLPNITGETRSLSGNCVWASKASGAFEGYSADDSEQISNVAISKEQSDAFYFIFDASRSNPIYGNSDTVQPPALTMVYIIKAFHTNEGVDSKNEVSDPIIEYVEGNLSRLSDYSTEEKVIGKWVDGKPVYEKTVFSSFTNYTVGETSLFSIPIGIVNVISIDGMVNYDSTYPVPVNYHYERSSDNNIQRISTYYSKNKGSIETMLYISKTTDYVNANYFVTIRYTKTTD